MANLGIAGTAVTEKSGSSGGGSGTVTSVALTVPGFLSVSGSPITTSGTLAVTLANQSASTALMGPAAGASATAPTFRQPSFGDLTSYCGPMGVALPNAKFVNIYQNITSTGDIDLYTVPSGKRALFAEFWLYNNSGNSLTYTPKINISGTYFRWAQAASSTLANSTQAAVSIIGLYVAEAGEKLSINVNQQPLNAWGSVIEFDNTSPLKTSKLTSLSSGNNTLYQVTSGKTAMVFSGTGLPVASAAAYAYFNQSGGSRTINLYLVPNGGSPGSTNQVVAQATVTNNTGQTNTVLSNGTMLSSQDSVVINTDAATATQYAWVTVIEL